LFPPRPVATPASSSLETPPAGDKYRLFEGEVLKFHKPGENPQINPKVRPALSEPLDRFFENLNGRCAQSNVLYSIRRSSWRIT